jgi:predicted PurR-regulated permease PerM
MLVLYWARSLVIPLALAVLFAFLMAPLVNVFQSWKLPRFIAVILTVALVIGLLGMMLRVVLTELGDLARTLPQHSQTLTQKIHDLRSDSDSIWNQIGHLINYLSDQLRAAVGTDQADASQQMKVVMEKETMNTFSIFPMVAGPALEVLLTLVFIVVLVVFILVRYEDLRDRLIQLAGQGRMAMTTAVLNEIGERIIRLMLRQLAINVAFGVLFGTGLWLIGIPYSVLWGCLAALLRFVPYVGSTIALFFPLLLAVAVFPGWWQPLALLILFVSLEVLTAYVAEPLLFSGTTGASPIAFLVAAAFWSWMWGALGLLLSGPLTVCLVVLGRYVPALRFFDVLLSQRPPLSLSSRYYYRLLARDLKGAGELLSEQLARHAVPKVCDHFVVPAMVLAKRDLEAQEMPQEVADEVFGGMRDTLAQTEVLAPPDEQEAARFDQTFPGMTILGYPMRDAGDTLALQLLAKVLQANNGHFRVVALEMSRADLAQQVKAEQPGLVCLGAVAPCCLTELQDCCKALRAEDHDVKILVGWWGYTGEPQKVEELLRHAGAAEVTFSLAVAARRARELLQATQELVSK